MNITMRYAGALGFIGAVALAGTAFGQGPRPTDDHARPGPRPHHDRLVTATATIQSDDGFATVRVDRGTVVSVEGATVTIERADGETVAVTATDDSRITRDGARAAVSDLRAGDHATVLQRDDGEGFLLRGIRAWSAEAVEERKAAREDRMGDRGDLRRRWRERMRDRMTDDRPAAPFGAA